MAAIYAIDDRHGRFMIVQAIQGCRREWRMQPQNRPPAWTTLIAEVPVVRT